MSRLSRRTLLQLSIGVPLCRAQQDPSWRARVAADSEAGERLVISGRVLRATGGAPASGAAIMVYQTDAKGIYSTKSGRPMDVARLRGRFTAGANGEYEIVTIRPGRYPDGGVPAHIHVNLVEPGQPPREVCEFFFAGDSLLRGNEKGYVLQLHRDAQGTWVAVQDFSLDK